MLQSGANQAPPSTLSELFCHRPCSSGIVWIWQPLMHHMQAAGCNASWSCFVVKAAEAKVVFVLSLALAGQHL